MMLMTIVLFAAPGMAQDIPGWEVSAGYSFQKSNVRKYFRSTPIIFTLRNEAANLHGWDVSVTENMNRWFGGTLDIRGHYARPEVQGVKNNERMYTLMYGPRFSFRQAGASFTPFTHVLFGVAHMKVNVSPGPSASKYSFAVAGGGGLDIKFSNNAAVRVIQADYLRADTLGTNKNSFRVSAGVILYLR